MPTKTEPTTHTGLARLRDPFPDTDYGYLPKPLRKDDNHKAKCENTPAGRAVSADGHYCGGWHTRSLHLAYVGHAALTKRLLEADDKWDWEPMAYDQMGLPMLDRNGGLWIKLTVAGVTRLGYGDAPGKTGGNAIKEVIGDALRNAAMRFGTALELWHKGELSEFAEPPEPGADNVQILDTPKVETPIVDAADPDDPTTGAAFWVERIQNAGTAEELRAIYREAGKGGALNMPVEYLGETVLLGAMIADIGKKLGEAEEAAEADAEAAVVAAEKAEGGD